MNIQLSISLLASDRPAALERCLDSLRPLLMKVPSELIITVTGTDKRIREIAERYTDHIITFTWCNDFSKARNVGLKAARGEWFLYLDDDEWFEDTEEICDFFLTGEYKKYGAAFYVQRNYHNWTGIQHSDFYAFRMAKITAGIRFQNSIHEELSPRTGDIKFFNTYVHHYGYVIGSGEKKAGKTNRNIPLLLKAINKNPTYIKNYVQLVHEYYLEKNWEKAEEYCLRGRKLCRGKQGANDYIRWFQVYLADIHCMKDSAKTAKDKITSILEKEKTCELVQLCLYSRLILLCTQLDEYREIISFGGKFEDIYIYMEKNPEQWVKQSYGDVNEERIKNSESLTLGRLRCIEAALHLKDSTVAIYFMNFLPWENEAWMQKYYSLFEQWRGRFPSLFNEISERLSKENPYLLFQKARVLNEEKDRDFKTTQFLHCMEKTVSLYLKQQIIKEAVFEEMELSRFVKQVELETWKIYMQPIVENASMEQISGLQKSAQSLKETDFIHGLWMEKLVLEKRLIQEYMTGCELMEGLSEYVQNVLSYYKEQYREDMFSKEKRALLPEDCRFAVLVSESLACIEAQNLPEAIKLLRQALQYYPSMTGVIHEVIRQLKNFANDPAKNAGAEFKLLAKQMKGNLSTMIRAGQYTQALPVMQQLCELLPGDLELLKLRQTLFLKIYS